MIECKNVSFSYSRWRNVFDDINLTLNEGHVYGLLGKNGEGKTTLLKLMSGLLIPQKGNCSLWGQDVKYRPVNLLQKLFMVNEMPTFPDVYVKEFFKMYAPFYPTFDKDVLSKCIADFEIDCDRRVIKLSHGQQKKVVISLALSVKTPLLFLDEPTNGLDIPSKRIFRQLLASLVDEKQIAIISTHQVRDLESLIDSVIVLNNKKVASNQTLDNSETSLETLFEEIIS